MAKNIRALRKGGEPGKVLLGPNYPNSYRNISRRLKGSSLPREKRAVILQSQVDALVGETYTARKRRKITRKLRRLRATVSS